MKTRKIITDHSKPTSQEDTKINYNTGTIGDDPTKSAELKASQEAEDKEKADKKLRDELEEIMKTRIAEQGKALADTFAEIMRGPVPDKKEEQKKDVKSNG